MSVTIIKLGGSLASSPLREAWLATLCAWGGPLILVPGGGPFARAVRDAQDAIGFDDAAAHRMALLAMEQFAIAISGFADTFVLADSPTALDTAILLGKIPVWLPARMVLAAPEIPTSWGVTSDSLAAWLAGVYGAARLLLIKSCDAIGPLSAEALAARQVVDPLFPRFAAQSRADIWLAGPASLPAARETLQIGSMPGIRVSVSDDEMAGTLVQE